MGRPTAATSTAAADRADRRHHHTRPASERVARAGIGHSLPESFGLRPSERGAVCLPCLARLPEASRVLYDDEDDAPYGTEASLLLQCACGALDFPPAMRIHMASCFRCVGERGTIEAARTDAGLAGGLAEDWVNVKRPNERAVSLHKEGDHLIGGGRSEVGDGRRAKAGRRVDDNLYDDNSLTAGMETAPDELQAPRRSGSGRGYTTEGEAREVSGGVERGGEASSSHAAERQWRPYVKRPVGGGGENGAVRPAREPRRPHPPGAGLYGNTGIGYGADEDAAEPWRQPQAVRAEERDWEGVSARNSELATEVEKEETLVSMGFELAAVREMLRLTGGDAEMAASNLIDSKSFDDVERMQRAARRKERYAQEHREQERIRRANEEARRRDEEARQRRGQHERANQSQDALELQNFPRRHADMLVESLGCHRQEARRAVDAAIKLRRGVHEAAALVYEPDEVEMILAYEHTVTKYSCQHCRRGFRTWRGYQQHSDARRSHGTCAHERQDDRFGRMPHERNVLDALGQAVVNPVVDASRALGQAGNAIGQASIGLVEGVGRGFQDGIAHVGRLTSAADRHTKRASGYSYRPDRVV